MKLRKIYITLLLTLFLGSFTSCNKWLELKPQDGIVGSEFWQTKEQVQSAVIGCYSSLLTSPPGNRDAPLVELLFMYGELRGDMVTQGPFASIDEIDLIEVNVLETSNLTNWRTFYRIINYCNNVIDLAPAVLQRDPTLTQTELNGYVAEALGLRAFLYLTLAKTWGDVPLKLTATKSDADNFQIPQSTQLQVFQQIEKDLIEAEAKAKTTHGSVAADKGRITKHTINAMQAELYLWLEDYNKCIEACQKIEDSGRFSLVPGNNAWFSTLYANGNSSEGIFEFQFDLQQLNPFYVMFFQRPRFLASTRVMEQVYQIDFTDETKFDIRGNGASLIASDNTIYKYLGEDRNTRKTLEQSFTHWFAYRYADVLLMKAEALNEIGDGKKAVEYIEMIRSRANALTQTRTDFADPDSDKPGVTDYILQERAREFAFEGKRWFDVLRNAKRNNYQRLDLIIDMVTASAPPDKQRSIISKYRDFNSHYLPVNFTELRTNKALVQNPFYK
ncbi:SusD family protein [Pedobacter glucosidilyticus]|uniref:RagB/SusD family nutrient uptake outer membrane protein n=1 Tax=Pedobacter aquae TaxID=2605747 RepID=A0A5C0VF81_9SPHI|nr:MULTISPECIES: RagB/SusD family nutrient uptake outer membrane protein [Pedobacter]KHJ39266.1 SusD family protein [Pedobacter glucosidilyticus]QEK51388.1 RagB/SusD family nutrient uptake outer membrane protein [Pedobacter aquae]